MRRLEKGLIAELSESMASASCGKDQETQLLQADRTSAAAARRRGRYDKYKRAFVVRQLLHSPSAAARSMHALGTACCTAGLCS